MTTVADIRLYPGDRVLLLQLRAIGDTLLLTPAIRSLRRIHPDIRIDVAVQPLPAQILENNPNINEIISFPRGNNVLTYIPVIGQLNRNRYRAVFDFLSTPATAVISRLSGSPIRVGYNLRGRGWAYTHPVQRRLEPRYNPFTKFDLFSAIGMERDDPIPELFPRQIDYASSIGVLEGIGASASAVESHNRLNDVIGLAPWSKREWRRWDIACWVKLIRRIDSRNRFTWLLFASEDEREGLRDIERLDGCRMIWAGADHLLKVGALTERCRLFISADNGLKHIAVAAETPTVTVYTRYPGVAPEVWNPPAQWLKGVKHDYGIVNADDEGVSAIAKLVDRALYN